MDLKVIILVLPFFGYFDFEDFEMFGRLKLFTNSDYSDYSDGEENIDIKKQVEKSPQTKIPNTKSTKPHLFEGLHNKILIEYDNLYEKYLKSENGQSPDLYFYNNVPAHEKMTEEWTETDTDLYKKRTKLIRPRKKNSNETWGIFSLGIPGKCGRQCRSYYYSTLIYNVRPTKITQLPESNLTKNAKNTQPALKFACNKCTRQDEQIIVPVNSYESYLFAGEKIKLPKSDLSELYTLRSLTLTQTDKSFIAKCKKSRSTDTISNPLLKIIDPISKTYMTRPAMSPDGTVLDYSTWMKAIRQNRKNPVNGTQITKNMLTIITDDNFSTLSSKFTNITLT